MRMEPFGLGKRQCSRTDCPKCCRITADDGTALHEVEYIEARGETRRARGRQHVISARHIVANGFRRIAPEEDGACV